MDSRTTDNSVEIINATLQKDKFRIVSHEFQGFGHARTRSLELAWLHFPQASHVWIADPDWMPDVTTMNIADLDMEHDVFRFISYDRNGITTRRMDWLLKHRKGLQMRYNLHEVLDIGYYNYKVVSWVIHEIEKPGSWHTTVGHGNSFSMQRYLFDLKLLEKDLIEYGHDPHTHYYLGVTHEAYASKLMQQTGLTAEVQLHADQAVKYLEMRTLSAYKDEFIEERWATMMELANLYSSIQNNFISAKYWLEMCKEFNPKQSECSLSLGRLFLGYGLLPGAVAEAKSLTRIEHKERAMLNQIRDWACDVPSFVVQVMCHQLTIDASKFSAVEAKYLLLLQAMYKENAQCEGRGMTMCGVDIVASVLPNQGKSIILASAAQLCEDSLVVDYLVKNEITLHPCGSAVTKRTQARLCHYFTADMPALTEEFQATTEKAFVGSLSFPDLMHHVFGGSTTALWSRSPFRVLFAEYFTLHCVELTLGFMQRHPSLSLEVHVVTANADLVRELNQIVPICTTTTVAKSLFIHEVTLDQYLADHMSTMRQENLVNKFDFIEYNGGLSFASNYRSQIRLLNQALSANGVIGVTYFTANRYEATLRKLIESRDQEIHVPFSRHVEYLIKDYLTVIAPELKIFRHDHQVIQFFGGTPGDVNYYTHPSKKFFRNAIGAAFSQAQVNDIVSDVGLTVQAQFPTAFGRPYDELKHHEVKRFWSLGVSQDHFVHDMMPSLRNTMYLSKAEAVVPGRINVQALFTDPANDNSVIDDRVGNLGASFSSATQRAKMHMSTEFSFCHYSAPRVNISFVALPSVSSMLPMLSSGATFRQLLNANLAFAENLDEPMLRLATIQVLEYFERLNMVTIKTVGASQPAKTKIKHDVDNTLSNAKPVQQSSPTDTDHQSTPESEKYALKRLQLKGLGFTDSMIEEQITAVKKKHDLQREPPVAVSLSNSSVILTSEEVEKLSVKRKQLKEMGFSDSTIEEQISALTKKMEHSKLPERFKPLSLNANTDSKSKSEVSNMETKTSSSRSTSTASSDKREAKRLRMVEMGFDSKVIEEQLAAFDERERKQQNNDHIEKKHESTMSNVPTEHISELHASMTTATNLPSAISSKIDAAKIDRLRAMGFSDAMIADKLKIPFIVPGNTKSTIFSDNHEICSIVGINAGNLCPAQDQSIGTSHHSTISTSSAAPVILSKASTSSPTAPADLDINLEKKIQSLKASGYPESMIQGVIEAYKTRQASPQSEALPTSQTVKKPKSITSVTNKLNSLLASAIPAGTSSSVVEDTSSGSELISSIDCPVHQTLAELQGSFRSRGCGAQRLTKEFAHSKIAHCVQPLPLKRRTAAIDSASISKLLFDIDQLRFISTMNGMTEETKMRAKNRMSEVEKLLDIMMSMEGRLMKANKPTSGVVRLSTEHLVATQGGSVVTSIVMNGAGIKRQLDGNLIFPMAMSKLGDAVQALGLSDFAVVDVILRPESLAQMVSNLLLSNIWFDCTNGNPVAAYPDDGLIFPEFRQLAQEIALGLSTNSDKQYNVKSYFAMAMNVNHAMTGPVMMAQDNELHAFLWLSPATQDITYDSTGDGLEIFDQAAAKVLFNQGISLYPSVHTHFLSIGGSLSIDVSTRCKNSIGSEIIPRKKNRLILVNSRNPTNLRTSSNAKQSMNDDSFDMTTGLVFVVQLVLA